MKFLTISFLFIYLLSNFSISAKKLFKLNASPLSASYDESPIIVKDPDVPIQSQIESPPQINPTEIIQAQGHYDHGVNLDNLDPNLEFIKSSQPQQPPLPPKETPYPMEPSEKNENFNPLKEINERSNSLKFNKTHDLIQQTFSELKKKARSVNSRKDVANILERIKLFNQALKLHNEELSKSIFQNYQILESSINQLLSIRETLLEMDLNSGNPTQKRLKLKNIKDLKQQIIRIRESLSHLQGLKDDQMWNNPIVLSKRFPSEIVHYFDLNSKVYQINQGVHFNIKKPCQSLRLLKKEAYYDPTKPQKTLTFINFKQYSKLEKESEIDLQTNNLLSKCISPEFKSKSKSDERFSYKRENTDQLTDSILKEIKEIN